MTRSILKATVIILILVFALDQITYVHSYVSATNRNVTVPQAAIPLLIESNHNLQPDEVKSLSTYGLITTVAGPVAVLHADPRYLDQLEQLPISLRVEHPHLLSVYLDKSVPDIGANAVSQEIKDPYGRNVTGAGVVIGFVDTGIDITHPDFYFPNGSTKILYVWDQTTRGHSPSGFGYGYECTSSDIQGGTCPEVDTFGHGTHVAGIAASSGQATGKYAGVAPDARIIFVKSGNPVCDGESWNFYDAQILDGISYIVEKAAELKMRAVISLSLGGNIGGHDGTAPLELGLDAFVQAGTPIAVAAGNSARDDAHIRGQLSEGGNITINVQVRATTTDLEVDLWHSNQDKFDATLVAPDSETYSIPTPPGGATGDYGNITTLASSSVLGKELYMEINATRELSTEVWRVMLKATKVTSGTGAWDAWVDTASCIFPGAFFLPGDGYKIDSHDTIGIPGTARYVVTVGAYVTKASWVGLDGKAYGHKGVAVGGITSFSSLGPTRDGRIKPDIVAPGMLIASARSAVIPKSNSDPDAFHRVLAGTSMATPHVAGVIALMLQYNPELQAIAIPRILKETARLDASTGLLATGSPVWGLGKVDSRTATGFFRLTLLTQGIPEDNNITVHVDKTETVTIPRSSWSYLYFLKGTRHTISLDTAQQSSPSTRYQLQNGSLNLTVSTIRIMNYTTQYFLTVSSQFGPMAGSGWYNANGTATVSVPSHVGASGLLSMIGGEYVLARLLTDDGNAASGLVVMDRPRTVTAVYVLVFPFPTYLELGGLLIVIALLIIRIDGRRRKPTSNPTSS